MTIETLSKNLFAVMRQADERLIDGDIATARDFYNRGLALLERINGWPCEVTFDQWVARRNAVRAAIQ